MKESRSWPEVKEQNVETVIVGAGLAGLAAAFQLKDTHFELFELSDRLGGTAGVASHEGIRICQGAHYDLDYPAYYGTEVLDMLEKLKLIKYLPWKKLWSFEEADHLIPSRRRQQCFENGQIRSDVIPAGPTKTQLLELLSTYEGKMPLPTRLISDEERPLDQVSFFDFLSANLKVDAVLKRRIDYHMMDDYGATSDKVSALAGIHYFACRPYYKKHVSLFSPPAGNGYFVEKIAHQLPTGKVHLRHLVTHIEDVGNRFELKVLDVRKKSIKVITAERVIYAGQKHALQYVYPQEAHLFDKNEYAPWMVINFVCPQQKGQYGFWQNEYLGEDPSFMGFIDSSVQYQRALKGKKILTAYYCLKPEDRDYLTTIPTHKEAIAAETQQKIEQFLAQDITPEKTYIQLMGHAMAIPRPGFLFPNLGNTRLNYAGVDAGRLPLLFEALDSGIMATKE